MYSGKGIFFPSKSSLFWWYNGSPYQLTRIEIWCNSSWNIQAFPSVHIDMPDTYLIANLYCN